MILTMGYRVANCYPQDPRWTAAMGSYETGGKSAVSKIAGKQPHELLIELGGALGIMLSSVLFGIEWYQGIPSNQIAAAMTLLVVNVVLGSALVITGAIVRRNVLNGAIVAAVVGLVLIVFGGRTGLITGIVGILGAALAAASPYMPHSKRA